METGDPSEDNSGNGKVAVRTRASREQDSATMRDGGVPPTVELNVAGTPSCQGLGGRSAWQG